MLDMSGAQVRRLDQAQGTAKDAALQKYIDKVANC